MSDRLEGKEVDMRLMYTGAALASVLFCTILYIRYEIDQQGKKIRPPQPNSDLLKQMRLNHVHKVIYPATFQSQKLTPHYT